MCESFNRNERKLNITSTQLDPSNANPRKSSPDDMPTPVEVNIIPGMPVYEVWSATKGTVVSFTQAYCIYRAEGASDLTVTPWHELALANIRPAERKLPRELAEIDLANARAALLREFTAAKSFGLTVNQLAAYHELVAMLCGTQQS